jgi:hypothetical protein
MRGDMRMPGGTRALGRRLGIAAGSTSHENRVGRTEGRKEKKGSDSQKEFTKGKRVDAD